MKQRCAAIVVMAVCAGAALSACGSSTTSGSTSAAVVPSAPAAASSSTASSPSMAASPAPSTCAQFAITAGHMATYVDYLEINIGTTNDEKPTLANLQADSQALVDLAPKCAPKAAAAVADFAAAAQAIVPIYTTTSGGAEGQRVQDALAAVKKAGAQMFVELGMATYAWE